MDLEKIKLLINLDNKKNIVEEIKKEVMLTEIEKTKIMDRMMYDLEYSSKPEKIMIAMTLLNNGNCMVGADKTKDEITRRNLRHGG